MFLDLSHFGLDQVLFGTQPLITKLRLTIVWTTTTLGYN